MAVQSIFTTQTIDDKLDRIVGSTGETILDASDLAKNIGTLPQVDRINNFSGGIQMQNGNNILDISNLAKNTGTIIEADRVNNFTGGVQQQLGNDLLDASRLAKNNGILPGTDRGNEWTGGDYSINASGGSKGPDTTNFKEVYQNGVQVVTQYQGEFTPSLEGATTAGSHIYDVRSGWYVVTGSLLYGEFDIRIESGNFDGSATGDLIITGIPKYALRRSAATMSLFQMNKKQTTDTDSFENDDSHTTETVYITMQSFGLILPQIEGIASPEGSIIKFHYYLSDNSISRTLEASDADGGGPIYLQGNFTAMV